MIHSGTGSDIEASGEAPPLDFDEYSLVRLIGRGAMGQVFLGHDTLLDRPVAIKWISAMRPDATTRMRFLLEARAVARLHHPNVVAIYRVGQVSGRLYLVTEFVEGQSLEGADRPMPWQQALRIGLGLGRGLGAAHHRGVLHRDIKPANLILTKEGEVKLLDFGLAKLMAEATSGAVRQIEQEEIDRLQSVPPDDMGTDVATTADPRAATGSLPWLPPAFSLTGGLVGTPLYMAPEIWRGEPATQRSDLYSAGALLYELCSGAPPHRGATLQEMRLAAACRDACLLDAAPRCDSRFAAIVDRCLRRDPAERFASADDLVRALEHLPLSHGDPLPSTNPYRGLAPFEAEHRRHFFGRDGEIRAVLDRLRMEPLLLLVGDSGVGKSSLCRAGVLPLCAEGALPSGRSWSLSTMVPGRQPTGALARALALGLDIAPEDLPPGWQARPTVLMDAVHRRLGERAGLLLFVDQLEELLTQGEPAETQQTAALLGHLAAYHPGVRVLMTVRGDYLTRLANLPVLGAEIERGLCILRPLPAEGLREAIEGPARTAGIRYESAQMIDELVQDTVESEGGLPLLQFTLAELWAAHDAERRLIPAAALQKVGGVAGALARHADRVLLGLPPAERAAARRILLKLVTPEGARAFAPEAELTAGQGADRVALQALVQGRLLVARQDEGGKSAYGIAHEALLRGWRTLRDWMDQSRGGRVVRERIGRAMAEWERLGRSSEALWSEQQVREVEGADLSPDDLGPRETAYLVASRRHAQARRRRRLALVLGIPLLMGVIGLSQFRAHKDRQQAEELAQAERGAKAASLAQQPGMEVEALLAAISAVQPSLSSGRPPPRLASEGLAMALVAARQSRSLPGHESEILSMSYSPDGTRLVTAAVDGIARLWDAHTGQPLAVLRGHEQLIPHATFSPSGTRIATASMDRTVRLWDGHTGRALSVLRGHLDSVNRVRFSADGMRLVTASDDGTARLWDATTGRPLLVLSGHSGDVDSATFSPDGTRVLTSSGDHSARLWDGTTGQPLFTLRGHSGTVLVAEFSPDGARIATGSLDHSAMLWDGHTAERLATLLGHSRPIYSLSFSPDGSVLATGGPDGTARLWDGRTGELQTTLQGHSGQVATVGFSPDGLRVITGSRDGTAKVWDTGTGQQLRTLLGHRFMLSSAIFSPDGQQIATSSHDHTVRLWNGRSEQHLTMIKAHEGQVWGAAFSPDGTRVVTYSVDTTVRLWDGHTGRHVATLNGHSDLVRSVVFSPTGTILATMSHDHTARLWDGHTGRYLLTLMGHQSEVWHAAFSPDGERIVTTGRDGTGRLWQVRTGKLIAVLAGHKGLVHTVVFSPDGTCIATASHDATARLWDGHDGHLLFTLKGHADRLSALAISPDGTHVLTGSLDSTARLWDRYTGQPARAPANHPRQVLRVAFAPDGSRVLTVSLDGMVRLWDGHTLQPLAVMKGPEHAREIYRASFSHDGTRIVTGAGDGALRIWDGYTGHLLSTLEGHPRSISEAVFSPDDGRLLTSSMDGSARLWDARTGRPLASVGNPVDPLRPATVDDHTLVGPVDSATLHRAVSEACQLLRYQPHFDQVRRVCQSYL